MGETFAISKLYEESLDINIKKSKGVYYTPKIIVDYILNKTIKNHDILKNQIQKILNISFYYKNFLLNSYNIFSLISIYNDFKLFFKHKFNKIKEFILFPPVKFTIIFLFSIFFINFSNVKKENEELSAKNAELENKLVEYDRMKEENTRLREIFNYAQANTNYDYLGCNIIGYSGGNITNEYKIDKGINHDFKKDMFIITTLVLV